MARLIDANTLMEQVNNLCSDGNENWIGTDNKSYIDHADVVDIISDAPTVDAVEVVRCKECKHCRTFYPVKEIGKEAIQAWYCVLYRCNRKPDEFCSDGERREGE